LKPNWKANTRGGPSQQTEKSKVEYPREEKNTLTIVKGNNVTPISRNHDIKCFHCQGFGHVASQYPNKRVMIIKANNEFETDMDYEEEKIPPLKDNDDVYVEYPVEEKTLMVRRALNMHVNVVDSKGYRENIFQTRYHVYNKVCSLIIDGGSCTNITSAKLMRKLNLHTTKHLIPYKL